MRYSWNWLLDYADPGLSAEEALSRLPGLGLEVAWVQRTGPGFSGVVVGEVLKVDKHPNADRLSLCEVTDGTETLAIVCGAKNVAAGQKVALAKVGALLPGDFKITRSKIRGVESNGMICSAKELGLGQDHEGILVLPPDSAPGTDFASLAGKPDVLFDLEITPNRADVLSHFGLARELSVAFGVPLKDPVPASVPASGAAPSVQVLDAEGCPRYMGRLVSGIKVGPSPRRLAERLTACGLRPINNVVDVTNYVLLELGHPLHAFDQDKLQGGVVVRRAAHGELFKGLDGREYVLEERDLVVADRRHPAALAGVIGGAETAVGETTKTVLLETAYFRPADVRRTARRLRIRTDSSYRFERGTDPNAVDAVSRRAVQLLLETCGGAAAASTPADAYPRRHVPPVIKVETAALSRKLGLEIPEPELGRILEAVARPTGRLTRSGEGWELVPPGHRTDLADFEDAAEEAARLHGYGKIPARPESVPPSLEDASALRRWTRSLSDRLASLGFSEAMNYDFLSVQDLLRTDRRGSDEAALDRELPRLANPLSADWVYLRTSLVHGLLRSLARNVNRGAETVLLFESGRAYAESKERPWLAGLMSGRLPDRVSWARPGAPIGFFDLKGVVEALFAGAFAVELGSSSLDALHPRLQASIIVGGKPAGTLGRVHPVVEEGWKVPEAWFFELRLDALPEPKGWARKVRPFTSFPVSRRDLSFVLSEERAWSEVEPAIRRAAAGPLLALDLVDVFAGKGIPSGRRSLTVRLTLGAMDRTLSDADINAAVDRTLKALQGLGAELRS